MTRWVPAPPPSSASGYVERGLTIFAILWQIGWTVTDIGPRALGSGSVGVGFVVAGGLTWVALVLSTWGPASFRRLRPLVVAADLIVLSGAAIAYSLVAVEPGTWPLGTIAAVRAAVAATILLRATPGLVVATAVSAASAVTLVLGPADVGVEDAFLETLYAVALAIAGALLAGGMRRSGRRIDAAHDALATQESARLAEENVAQATLDHERRIHDQVLNTLAALSRGALPDAAEVRRRCADGARSLRALVGASGVEAGDPWRDVEAEIASLGAAWRVDRSWDSAAIADLPADVSAAMAVAAAEGIRNAGRHSGGATLTISARRAADTWTVEIVDDGVGISAGVNPGLGMSRSITAAMRDVGGSAVWSPSVSGGTRLALSWDADQARPLVGGVAASNERAELETDAVGVLPGIGPPYLLSFLAYATIVVAAGWPFYPHPTWALAWLLLAWVVAPFAGMVPTLASRVGLTGGPTWSWRVLLGIGLSAVAAIAIVRMEELAVADAAMPVWVTWSSEVAVGLLFVTILLGPPLTILPALVAWVIAQGGSLWELLQPGSFMLMVAAIFAASMRRRAREYGRATDALIRESARVQALAWDERRRRERFDSLAVYTAGLLDDIASGRLDPGEESVRRRCADEERVARSLVRVDREAGAVEALLHDMVVAARQHNRFLDADLVGERVPVPAHAADALRVEVLTAISATLPVGTTARVTAGVEDQRLIVRLTSQWEDDVNMWEWGADAS